MLTGAGGFRTLTTVTATSIGAHAGVPVASVAMLITDDYPFPGDNEVHEIESFIKFTTCLYFIRQNVNIYPH